jgi:hypothetical protein
MAYISAAEVAIIRTNLKAAFPPAKGWKFGVRLSSGHLGVEVSLLAGPVVLLGYDYNPYAQDADTARTSSEAQHRNAVLAQTSGSINHYHFREHYTPDTVKILESIIAITMAKHWDRSDIQSDYFSCAFYPSFSVGTYSKPYVQTT